MLKGLRKRDTYNSLAGYLDGGQERMMYPDRLATQLKNSHQMSNLVDSDGKSWFEENKTQMRNFTEQQVHEVVVKENLEAGQTFQQQRILQQEPEIRQEPVIQHEPDARARQPKETQKGERGIETPATEGVIELFKKEMRNKIAQEAAAYVMKKAIEKLPDLIARIV